MLLEGVRLGRYELVKRIGGGGMGDVYLAEDPQIGQKVAIKVIKTEATLNIDMALMRDFQEEARAIAQLDHPHIMPLLAYSEQEIHGDTVAYIVMPYRKEGNLIQWLRSLPQADPLSPVELGQLIQQAASALKYAHDRNIIHRDIKPANFLVRENPDKPHQPDLLLSDFGLAKLTNATSSASQNVRGTPAYMPPEQWSGTAVAASDQYSLAVMAYEMLTGRIPFQGSPLQMMNQHISATPPAPSSFNTALLEGVDAVLLCALQKKPADRYPSAMDFADNLLNALNGLSYAVTTVDDEAAISAETIANTITKPVIEELKEPSEQEFLYATDKKNTPNLDTDAPIRPAVIRSRPDKIKLLFGGLAAAIIFSLVVGSFVLILSPRNIGKLGKTTAQSAAGNSVSPTVKISPTPSPKPHTPTPTPTTKHKNTGGNGNSNNSGNNGGNNNNNGSGSLPPVVNNPTPTPIPQPTTPPQPTPTPTPVPPPPTPTPVPPPPTPTPTPVPPPPTPTPTPAPPPPTPTPTPQSYPNINGTYSGHITNTYNSPPITASLTITFNQNGGSLGGYCSIGAPLFGSGPISGNISQQGYVSFTSYDTADGLNIYFTGSISGGYLQGTYTSSNGQYGTWIV